jgi:hypothetical protein
MATTPSFASTVRCALGALATADTARTGTPTNVVTIFTAGSSGSRIDEIDITATGTTTSNVVRLWIYNGSTYYLFQEVIVSAITPSVTQAVFSSTLTFNNFMLPSGYSLRATTNNTEGYVVAAFGGDF